MIRILVLILLFLLFSIFFSFSFYFSLWNSMLLSIDIDVNWLDRRKNLLAVILFGAFLWVFSSKIFLMICLVLGLSGALLNNIFFILIASNKKLLEVIISYGTAQWTGRQKCRKQMNTRERERDRGKDVRMFKTLNYKLGWRCWLRTTNKTNILLTMMAYPENGTGEIFFESLERCTLNILQISHTI